MTPEDEEKINKEDLPETLPILSLRNTVLFPGVVIPITAGRDKSIKLIDDANKGNKVIGVVSQKDEAVEDPKAGDIHLVGTVARILKVLKMPDGNTTVIIQGKKRFSVAEVITEEPYINATVREVPEAKPAKKNKEFKAITDSIKELALQIIKDSPNIPSEASFAIQNIESDSFLINFVSSNMNLPVEDKQKLLEINDLKERALETLKFMNIELQKLELKNDIQSKVQSDMNQQQREYFLNQQMKTIQEELGGGNAEEMEEMKKRAKDKKWDDKVSEHFKKELSKMQRMNPQVAEYSIQRNYLDLFLDLPWNEFSKDKFVTLETESQKKMTFRIAEISESQKHKESGMIINTVFGTWENPNIEDLKKLSFNKVDIEYPNGNFEIPITDKGELIRQLKCVYY